jgi:hypothetical protein
VVPGSMFGVPLKSIIMLPSWLPLILGCSNVTYLLLVTLPVSMWGAQRIKRWMDDPFQGELVLCSKIMPLAGFIHLGLASRICRHSEASAAISFYISTWLLSQTLNQVIKNIFWRRRPTACLSEKEGLLAARHFPQFKIWLMERPQSLESFPSGDAAGVYFCACPCTVCSCVHVGTYMTEQRWRRGSILRLRRHAFHRQHAVAACYSSRLLRPRLPPGLNPKL